MSSLSEILSGGLDLLSAPGRYTRGALAGRPGESMGGREMLESWGALAPNKQGLDFGDVAGFLAEAVVDPLNLIPVGALGTALRLSRKAVPPSKGLSMSRLAKRAAPALSEGSVALEVDGLTAAGRGFLDGNVANMLNPDTNDYADLANQLRLSEFESGMSIIQGEYAKKLRDTVARTGDFNITNPESGLKLWANPSAGMEDLSLLKGKQPILMDQAVLDDGMLAAYQSPTQFGAIDARGRLLPQIDPRTGDRVRNMKHRRFLLAPASATEGGGVDAVGTGFHEGLHALLDSENIDRKTWDYLQSLPVSGKDAIESSGRTQVIPRYLQSQHAGGLEVDPRELYSNIADVRTGLTSAGFDPVVTDEMARFGTKAFGPSSNQVLRGLLGVLGRDKLNEAMKYLPAVLAGPAAAAAYIGGEA